MTKFISKHWGTVVSIAASIPTFIYWPAVASYSMSHKNTALGTILGWALTLYYARAPKDKVFQ